MRNAMRTVTVLHKLNGFADDQPTYVEVEGQKYVADETDATKPKLGEDGKPIPFKSSEGKGDDGKDDPTLEELAKTNPDVARLLERTKELEDERSQRERDEDKRKEEEAKSQGKWQQLAEERAQKLDEVNKKLGEKDEILGKYVNSTKAMLAEVMATIPKENIGLVPENFSPREKLEYITKNAKLLGATITGGKGGKVDPNDAQPAGTDEEKLTKQIEDLRKKDHKTEADHQSIWELSKKLKEIRATKDGKK